MRRTEFICCWKRFKTIYRFLLNVNFVFTPRGIILQYLNISHLYQLFATFITLLEVLFLHHVHGIIMRTWKPQNKHTNLPQKIVRQTTRKRHCEIARLFTSTLSWSTTQKKRRRRRRRRWRRRRRRRKKESSNISNN